MLGKFARKCSLIFIDIFWECILEFLKYFYGKFWGGFIEISDFLEGISLFGEFASCF